MESISEIIEKYLAGQLTEEERLKIKGEISKNPDFRKELEIQKIARELLLREKANQELVAFNTLGKELLAKRYKQPFFERLGEKISNFSLSQISIPDPYRPISLGVGLVSIAIAVFFLLKDNVVPDPPPTLESPQLYAQRITKERSIIQNINKERSDSNQLTENKLLIDSLINQAVILSDSGNYEHALPIWKELYGLTGSDEDRLYLARNFNQLQKAQEALDLLKPVVGKGKINKDEIRFEIIISYMLLNDNEALSKEICNYDRRYRKTEINRLKKSLGIICN